METNEQNRGKTCYEKFRKRVKILEEDPTVRVAAILSIFFVFGSWLWEMSDRKLARTVAEETLTEIQTTRAIRKKEQINSAWSVLTSLPDARTSKVAALEFLAQNDQELTGLDQSCATMGQQAGEQVSKDRLVIWCMEKVQLQNLSLGYLRIGNLVNLSGSSFSNTNMVSADLSGANLTRVNFQGVDLSSSSFYGADLTGALLVDAELAGSNISNAQFFGAKWSNDPAGLDLKGTWAWKDQQPKGLGLGKSAETLCDFPTEFTSKETTQLRAVKLKPLDCE